jgi:hypothetical protein
MVMSSFGHNPCLWCKDAPTKYKDVIPTPWAMTCVLDFVVILQAHKYLVQPQTVFCCYYSTHTIVMVGGRLAERKG